MVAEQERVTHDDGPDLRYTMEALIRIPQQRSAVRHHDVEVGGRRERLDTAYGTRTAPQGRRDGQSAHDDDETADGEKDKERQGCNEET